MKIARKFALAVIAGIVVVQGAAAVYRVKRESAVLESTAIRDARTLGRAIGHAVEKTWTKYGSQAALEVVAHATERESYTIRWVQLGGTPDTEHAPTAASELLGPLSSGEAVVTTLDSPQGETVYTYVPVSTRQSGHGAIEVAHPLAEEQRYVRQTVANDLIVMTCLLGLSGLITWVLGARLIGTRVDLLVEQARAIARGDLQRRLCLPIRDELGELAAELDSTSQQLEAARRRLQEETQSRVAALEQLRHADRLTTVGTLASGIAHELGTPLNVIEGHAALIRESSGSAGDTGESTEVIIRQTKRMATIIRQLLDFARRDAPSPERTDAVQVVRHTLEMIAPMARKHSVELTVDAPAEAYVSIRAESLQQTLANLLVNAIQATTEPGTVRVSIESARTARPGAAVDLDWVLVNVIDHGSGMELEVAQRVFEPFFTTKDVGQGTGLGLAVAYGLVDDAGGWFDVRSSPNRGTTFAVYLRPES